jgi:hypothetical protein
MTTEKELRLSYNELKKVAWICQHCGAEHSLDLSDDKQVKELYRNAAGQTVKFLDCGICRRSGDAALSYALHNLIEFHKQAADTRNKISFRVSINDKRINNEIHTPEIQ